MKEHPHTAANAVELHKLQFAYGDRTTLAIDDYILPAAAHAAVIGPSGCGKTTFVHLIAGLLSPSHGEIRVLGQDIAALTESQRDRFRGRHIGFVFQQLHLIPALTVRENVAVAQRLARSSTRRGHIDELLARLGLQDLGTRRPDALSLGQAQRVAIARALVHSPELIIADEPTSALDDDNATTVLDLLVESAEQFGAALMVVTHDRRIRGRLASELSLGEAA